MTKAISLFLICTFTLLSNLDAKAEPGFKDKESVVNDYTFSCWLNGWRKNANDGSADIFGIETNAYGFTLDVADFTKVGLGLLDNPIGYEQALNQKAEKLKTLPSAELLIELELDGQPYRAKASQAGQGDGPTHLYAARLWESGRFVQHYDFQGLVFRNAKNETLACDAVLDLVAWPGSLTLTANVAVNQSYEKASLRLGLNSKAGNWNEELLVENGWNGGQQKSVTLTCPLASSGIMEEAQAIAVETPDGTSFPVRFDPQKNCYVASVKNLRRSWKTGYTDIRNYDEFKITVKESASQATLPFMLDMRPPANVTGLCPMLCDEEGRPIGIPVQLSKNWHNDSMGAYFMPYTLLPADKTRTYLLRVAYGFYGTLPSASHAQLSLLGYVNAKAGNGRWDQLAIGCWGETICFDMDMSLVDVAITDIRMLMSRNGLSGQKWQWTEAGWGGDWLNIEDANQKKFFWTDLKTAYLAHGPCLTDVKYDGFYGINGEVDFRAQIQTTRTDDYARTFQKLSYTFTSDVSAKDISLYKLGRTNNYNTPTVAYGNRDGLLKKREVPDDLKPGTLFLEPVELSGSGPHWVAFAGASETANPRGKPNGYRALIVRRYEALVGGKTFTQPTISAPVHSATPNNVDIELLPPSGIRKFSRGDRIELDLELITLPRVADDYYGPNESFRKHLTANANSWKTTHREARGNDLIVSVSGGTMLRNYPLVIQAQEPEVTVVIKGGVGAVPIRFEGLTSNQGYSLHRVADGKRIELEQSVHGHDFWQTDFDAATNSYKMSFNLPLDGLEESQWVFTRLRRTQKSKD
ncbi:hypothetical protein Poly51_26330 [Rubripirellula tenax]|uniref:Uncharacterized protein n=1 Tax=Rubripirellula tenax TaxID=2528015 RepID=A0A5C6F967_9BACT|nr:hypothetical protein [Rubripirellula tenax]TWU56716.1 hypothetical protein Poly51_26330 [Rubripirellula tenax]